MRATLEEFIIISLHFCAFARSKILYLAEKYLPTFSSHPIELNMHRIKGLSEHFVYFNDDIFLNGSIEKEFFFKNGKPCDYAYLTNVFLADTNDCFGHICTNNTVLINREFSYIKSFLGSFRLILLHRAAFLLLKTSKPFAK